MGTWNAFYVRANGDSTIAAVHKMFPAVKVDAGQDFIGVTLDDDDFDPPTEVLTQLSSDLGADVIWLSFQSTVDAFQFHHWRDGMALRSLVFGCYEERTWERAQGQPESWERATFFDPKMLRHSLEHAKTDDEKKELERIWREAELLPGRAEPSIDARESARKVAEYYQFPGWG